MSTEQADGAPTERRIGRPPKLDEFGTPTRERLLDAALAACIENGYEEATLSDIARRADVSTPAVYSHFSGKAELMIAASKRTLERITTELLPASNRNRNIVKVWMAPEAFPMRRLLLELQRAAPRNPELAELLSDWQRAHAASLDEAGNYQPAELKMIYLLMMGLLHLEDLAALEADHDELVAEATDTIARWTRS